MRALAASLLLVALTVPPCPIRTAAAEVQPPQVLIVGRPVAFRPAALPVSIICDDTSVVRVEDAGTFLRLTGLKPGATECSFGSALRPGQRQVYRFDVRAAQ
jgi:hypothetical protein